VDLFCASWDYYLCEAINSKDIEQALLGCFQRQLMRKKARRIVFFSWFSLAGDGDLCFDRSSGAPMVRERN